MINAEKWWHTNKKLVLIYVCECVCVSCSKRNEHLRFVFLCCISIFQSNQIVQHIYHNFSTSRHSLNRWMKLLNLALIFFSCVPSITDQIKRFDFQQLCIVVGGGGGEGIVMLLSSIFYFFFLFLFASFGVFRLITKMEHTHRFIWFKIRYWRGRKKLITLRAGPLLSQPISYRYTFRLSFFAFFFFGSLFHWTNLDIFNRKIDWIAEVTWSQ